MAISQPYSGSASIGATETSLVTGTAAPQSSTVAGVYQLMLDLVNLVAGDSYIVRIKEVANAGSQRTLFAQTITGPVSDVLYASSTHVLLNGWDITLQQLSGAAARTVDWSIRKVA